MTKIPIAVLISDVHYSLKTLEVADKAMRLAIDKANYLNVPLVVAGDLHDTKANMRAECMNVMLDTFSNCRNCIILRGNHDQINERSEEHALKFLNNDRVWVAERATWTAGTGGIYVIPYQHDPDAFRLVLKDIPEDHIIIAHQGLQGSNAGDYFQDHSALRPEDVSGRRVISGHYHRRQTIALPDSGTWDYIGNPYTLNFGEANDPEKGFQILHNDGSLEFVPTNLRKHVIIDTSAEMLDSFLANTKKNHFSDQDILFVKVRGDVAKIDKEHVAKILCITQDFRLDLITNDVETAVPKQAQKFTDEELMDGFIDSANTDDNVRTRLKSLWKNFANKGF